MIYLDSAATTLCGAGHDECVGNHELAGAGGTPAGHAGGGDGLSVPVRTGGAVSCRGPGAGGTDHECHPWAEHCHQKSGSLWGAGADLRL